MFNNTVMVILLLLPMVGYGQIGADTSKARATTHSHSTTTMSPEEKAELWGISPDDYLRYTEIMEGPLKHWNPNINPVLALGIYARTEGERIRFAEIYAEQERALTEKTQAFERAYREAFHRLHPDTNMIMPALMAPYYEHQARKKGKSFPDFATNTLLDGDRIIYFVDVACTQCRQDVDKLQSLIKKRPSLVVDIYILNIEREAEARQWASDHGIDVGAVKQGRITINIDKGVYEEVSQSSEQKTHFYLHRNGKVFALSRKGILLQ